AVVLWARRVLPDWKVAASFGIGMMLSVIVNPGDLYASNPWKFGWAAPVTVVALALAGRTARKGLQLWVTIALASASALADSRSFAGALALAAVLQLWQMRPTAMSRRAWWGSSVLFVGAVALVVYNLGTSLLIDGYF